MSNILSVAGPNSKYKLPGVQPAGFLAGLWHGIIVPIVFIVSIFNTNARIYETNNKGIFYDFGFVIGVSVSFGGGGGRVYRY